jgi:hypothetical protein
MARKFDFASPGIEINEIDQSRVSAVTQEDGILLVGRSLKGPSMKPVKVRDLDSFIEVFGEPQSGKPGSSVDVWRDGNRYGPTYAAYAAQAHLASNTSPVTFIRLLGENNSLSEDSDIQAGWKLNGGSPSTSAPESNTLAYGLFIMPSASAAAGATGSLAAVIYTTGSAATLRGIPAEGSVVTSSTAQLIKSQTSGQPATFKLDIWSDASNKETYTFHFNSTNKEGYIRTVLNTNPQKVNTDSFVSSEKYFLGETFEESVRSLVTSVSGTAGDQYGILLPLVSGSTHYLNNIREATAPKSGWIISRNPSPTSAASTWSSAESKKLFRIVSLHEGEWIQENYAVRIYNLKLGTVTNPNSTFSIAVINKAGDIIENFSNMSLNEGSENFILKKIGDEDRVWDTTNKIFNVIGEYPNRSNYIRIEMSDDWKAGLSDKYALPFGFYGPSKIKSFGLFSGSAAVLDSNEAANVNAWVKGNDYTYGSDGVTPDFASLPADMTASFIFPRLRLTEQSSKMNGNYNKTDVLGVRHVYGNTATSNKVVYQSSDYADFINAGPGGLDVHAVGSSTETSFIFTLDEVKSGSTDGKWYWENGSMASATSHAKVHGTAKYLKDAPSQFNVPLFGGFDGVDITMVEPFSNRKALADMDVKSHYAYNTIDKAIEIIADPESVKFDVVSIPGLLHSGLQNKLIRKVEERGDALVIIDLDDSYNESFENSGKASGGDFNDVLTTVQTRDINSSYAATYFPRIKLRDTTSGANDVLIAPASVAGIGAIAYSEANSDGPWFAPAGFNRGGISILGGQAGPRTVGTYKTLSKQNRDELYQENVNPIARFPALGEIVIFGQKTLQQTPSALDRINVRRLMIYLKKKVGAIADTILFEQNVQATWNRFLAQADPLLSSVRARFGITDYKLVLDSSTTTEDLIDRNILYAKVFVKPAKAIEYIVIDFVVTRTGVEF